MPAERLSQILWRERELLETLHFKLEVERLILTSGQTHWLAKAASEIESVLGLLRETEILRSVAADDLAAAVGLEPNASLRSMAAVVEEPWRTIFDEHREAFEQLTRDLVDIANVSRELLAAGLRSTRDVLLSIDEQTVSYGADGGLRSQPAVGHGASILDRSI